MYMAIRNAGFFYVIKIKIKPALLEYLFIKDLIFFF